MSSWRLKVNPRKISEGAGFLRSGGGQSFRKELPLHGFPHLLGAGLLQTLRDMHPPPNDLHEDQPPSCGTQEFHLVKSMSFLNSEQENSGVLKKKINSRNWLWYNIIQTNDNRRLLHVKVSILGRSINVPCSFLFEHVSVNFADFCVSADDVCHQRFSYFIQLFWGEFHIFYIVFVVKSISVLQCFKLQSDDASK